MIKTSVGVQELRRRIAIKAKADKQHRFWGLYCHLWKMDVIEESYRLNQLNRGVPGADGMSFEDIERSGRDKFLKEISDSLKAGTYTPDKIRTIRIPKRTGKTRILKVATIKDRVVQGALKLILEPVFEMDFMDGSYGYRPRRSAHQALDRVRANLYRGFCQLVDIDIQSFFDEVPHDKLLVNIAARVQDNEILALCKKVLKTTGKKGLPQGSLIGPLFSNIFLNSVDQMLDKMRRDSFDGRYYGLDYIRFADDILVMCNFGRKDLPGKAMFNMKESLASLRLQMNPEKSRMIRLFNNMSFNYLGFNFQLRPTGPEMNGRKVICRPQRDRRTEFLRGVKDQLRRVQHFPVKEAIGTIINPRVQGWVNYFSWGNSGRDFSFVRWRIDQMVRKFASRQQPVKRGSRSWTKWRRDEIYGKWGLFSNYRVKPRQFNSRAAAT